MSEDFDHVANNRRIQRMLRRMNNFRAQTISMSDTVYEEIMKQREYIVSDWKSKTGLMPSESQVAIHILKDELGNQTGFRFEIRRFDNQ